MIQPIELKRRKENLRGFRDGFNANPPKKLIGEYFIGYQNGTRRRNLDVK